MKLLISAADEQEAAEAFAGRADIIDVKNPKEGALGASFPWTIKRIVQIAPANIEVSCTLGDLPNLPGSVSLAALGAAATGVDYIKVGLGGVQSKKGAIFLLRNAVKAAKDFNPSIKVVAAGYADAVRVNSIKPLFIPEIADEANADVAMVDTAVKDSKNLFTFLTREQTRCMVDEAHDRGLLAALAGSLRKEHILSVYEVGADIIGMRGAACTNIDRFNGRIVRENVLELADIMKSLQAAPTNLG